MLDVFSTLLPLHFHAPPRRTHALLAHRHNPLVHLLPSPSASAAPAVLDLRAALELPPCSAARRGPAIDLILDHAREVDHRGNRAQALLGRDGRVVRRGRVEAAVREREGVREEAERGWEDEVAERLGDDAPHEDR